MSSLSMVEATLPPGFRFHPRDDELVCDYLAKKLSGHTDTAESPYSSPIMIEVDLNKCEPWDLPEMACVGGKEWYFYCLRDRKYATGQRTNRATESGYWKATGKDRRVNRRGILVGMRKTLVFYKGRAPKGKKTDWVMHEYRMEGFSDQTKLLSKEDWVLCRIIDKSRTSSRPNNETSYEDNTGASSLPSLTDTYFAFEQARLERYEQVPCFSNISHNSAGRSTNVSLVPLVHETNFTANTMASIRNFTDLGHTDNKVLKAVLNHFKLEGSSKSEYIPDTNQGIFGSYLSENGFSYMWNNL